MTRPQPVDVLEPRRLLAVFASVVDDVLFVGGDREADLIEFERRGDRVAVFGDGEEVGEFDATRLQRVVVDAGGGDDTVILGRRLGVAAHVLAGDGDDTVGGGDRGDLIDGGPGDDLLDGNHGTDTIYGGGGDDRIFTGPTEVAAVAGDAQFFDETLPDVVWGGGGADRAAIGGHAVLVSGVEDLDVRGDAERYLTAGPSGFGISQDREYVVRAPAANGFETLVGELRRDGGVGGYAFEWTLDAGGRAADVGPVLLGYESGRAVGSFEFRGESAPADPSAPAVRTSVVAMPDRFADAGGGLAGTTAPSPAESGRFRGRKRCRRRRSAPTARTAGCSSRCRSSPATAHSARRWT